MTSYQKTLRCTGELTLLAGKYFSNLPACHLLRKVDMLLISPKNPLKTSMHTNTFDSKPLVFSWFLRQLENL